MNLENTKDHTLYDSTYRNALKREILRGRKQTSDCWGLGGGERRRNCLMATGFLLEVMKMFWNEMGWRLQYAVKVLKASELYTLKG